MKYAFVILLVTELHLLSTAHPNQAHLKPFGSVGSLVEIEEINGEFPTVLNLFTDHIANSKPVVSRQVLNKQNHFDLWQSNEQLEKGVYGLSQSTIHIETFVGKRRERVEMPFGEFLDRHEREALVFADNVPIILQKYLVVPQPLQCEATLETFQSILLLINGINTSPLLFAEEHDHFHCIFRGQKRLVLVDTQTYPDVRQIVVPEKGQNRRPPLNPDSVDLDQFPALADVQYHTTTLASGDCLFIPSGWVFQERSLESTIGVIYNINHYQATDISVEDIKTCQSNHTYDDKFTLDQIDWITDREPPNLRDLMMKLINGKVQGFEKWQKIFSKHLSYDLASDADLSGIFEEFYGIVDVNGDGEVSTTEVEHIDGAHQHHVSHILYELAKGINEKRKKTSTTKTGTKTDAHSEGDDDDEYSEDHRTDL